MSFAQEQARRLLVQARRQQQNRRATMLERSAQELGGLGDNQSPLA